MCGIFGIISKKGSGLNDKKLRSITERLFVLSEARGKESAGIAVKNTHTNAITVLKKSIPASTLIRSAEYQSFYADSTKGLVSDTTCTASFAIIAHARLVTNGSQENNNNNQPCIKDQAVAVHNGIITNVDQLWEKHASLKRLYEVDTEVLLSILREHFDRTQSLTAATQTSFREMEGTASVAILNGDLMQVILATNNGSLYYSFNQTKDTLLFASEAFILRELIEREELGKQGFSAPVWMDPGTGFTIDIESFERKDFSLRAAEKHLQGLDACSTQADTINNYSPDTTIDIAAIRQQSFYQTKVSPLRNLLQMNSEAIGKLRRCSNCILPETFPFIHFDEKGVCNYCKHYVKKHQISREKELKEIVEPYRSKTGGYDVIMPFSGGRDSSYGLHYVVHELKMKPLTYTYDWGMVTDLARRNIARICGKLGVENIIVSADITKKRSNIRKNVEAWLKNPQLGMIPLFMAGDKHFFYYVNQLKKQTGIKLNIWCGNTLENTDFKVGFCGIEPVFEKPRHDYLPLMNKLRLGGYYSKEFLTNSAYLNSSLLDTAWSFYSYYFEPRNDFYDLFQYIKWDEKNIEQTLFSEYNWELSPDTTTSWRIGDGTAAFYNYIYYTVAGFSEFDTFRSNQIREGLIDREEGLRLINQENNPRFESMLWYMETIGVDFEKAIKVINAIPKRYPVQ